jgi:site-specific DNA-methyltransferase (adenine-specific)
MDILTENYKLYNGDCLKVMDLLIEQCIKVDAIITDPPYGTTACKWDTIIPFDEMWERLNKLIKPNGAVILFGSEPFSSALRMSNIKNYKYDWIWNKVISAGHLVAKYRPMQQTELISVFYTKKCTYNPQMVRVDEEEYKQRIAKLQKKKTYEACSELTHKHKELSIEDRNIENYKFKHPTNILTFNKAMKECNNVNRVHPTQKPVDLLEYLIKTYTNEGELVLDFTMGSGSTGVACVNTNRKFIGIELDENYFNIATNRIFENYNK